MPLSEATDALLRHLATRPGHDEVKADFRELLVQEFGIDRSALKFERRVPEVHGRLDALIGRTVFEAKSNLDLEWRDIENKMPDYLADREREEKAHFVGIGSDGAKWAVFELAGDKLSVVKRTTLLPDKGEEFLAWLDGALALKSSLPPDALTIRAELGHDSVAFHLVDTRLKALWEKLSNHPDAMLKRQLWGDLLRLVYGKDVQGDALWFQHTFLVIVAKCVALAVMGLNEDNPRRLLSGEAFAAAGISGAVESDFFDWVVADADGEALVRRIMNHVRRFRLAEVESDVLKILYESLIDRAERHGLGEYYTPDWLAAKIVREAVERPTEQRVLDPACGSGTFLFHAVRNFFTAAAEGDMDPTRRATEVCEHVAGMDIHPVAVIIARVTYLLALAPALSNRRGPLSIPVYLGDAMQLSISEMIGGRELSIRVPPPPAGQGQSGEKNGNGREQLDFPETFCRDPALFDKAIERMRLGSVEGLNRAQIEAALHRITEQHYRADVTNEQKLAIQDLGKTYVTFDRLRKEGRDTIWAYVARNLSRPLFLSSGDGWAHVVVGNPPWLSFRYMSADLQKRFKELAKGERILVGHTPSQNDLCALFTARSTHLYLRAGGRIALVLPLAALTRGQYQGLRSGSFASARVAWDETWTMDDSVQPLFPVPSCVVFGRRRATSQPMPDKVRFAFSGALPYRDAPEKLADKVLAVRQNVQALETAQHEGGSVYRTQFRNGATLFPRLFVFVERKAVGRLGADPLSPLVASRRRNQEKEPWKSLPALENRVEATFLRPILLGESILPFRVWRPFEGVLPVTDGGQILDVEAAANRGLEGLTGWMRKSEEAWDANKKSEKMKLTQLFDYFGQLSAQFPPAPVRVVYTKSGSVAAAAIIRDKRTIVENRLYWAAIPSEDEAHYLIAIFNSETTRSRIEQYQSRGQWGARDFDKVMFNLPILRFDEKIKLHRDLAAGAERAEKVAAHVVFPENVKFQRARGLVREALAEAGVAQEIDRLVAELLS